ncbi:Retrovirus Polyprotein [Phytophthora palmivora]|uniref:Retrovirus Polyprotein n=1 Tax=Phytophthora palmivora TaxID=4796 RepID=A0A2P4XXL4_9STRA|nr:Retrovirus Polyprotein [Phytophthora palmivora]
MKVHLKHLRRVLEVIKANNLYTNIDKCVFAAEEIKVLGCFVNRVGVRADPGKVEAIAAWPTPRSHKNLRNAGYAELARPLPDLSKKDAGWVLEQQRQDAFDSIMASLQHAPVLGLVDKSCIPMARLLSADKDVKGRYVLVSTASFAMSLSMGYSIID